MVFERIIRQQLEAIQFDGTNLKEVYEFICEHNSNSNKVTYKQLLELLKRPEEIPINTNTDIEYYNMEGSWKEKWFKELKLFKDARMIHGEVDEKDYLPEACLKERDLLRLYQQSWRPGELYHIYIPSKNNSEFCRMVGISVGDWFVVQDSFVEHESDDSFQSLIENYGWQVKTF